MDEAMEKAFQETAKVILGKTLSGLDEYGPWLNENTEEIICRKSALGKETIYTPGYVYYKKTGDRFISMVEREVASRKRINEGDVKKLTLANAKDVLKGITLFCPDAQDGTNVNMDECSLYSYGSNCYRSVALVRSKHCAYSFWPRNSEYIFGSDIVFSSSFCLKCYHSENITRCLEVSNSANCGDCYFCHNCENVNDSMFCFNAKNLRYAIGNKEVGREAYMKLKKRVLEEIAGELERSKRLRWSIYDIGCYKS
ncbi:MAG: hypothetical protein ACP5NX_00365 [Candidatus Bilamarchaeaceae archaeon]